jgi:hypothetical protein
MFCSHLLLTFFENGQVLHLDDDVAVKFVIGEKLNCRLHLALHNQW